MSVISKAIPESKSTCMESVIPLRGISWQTYKTLMAEMGENRGWRIAYDLGVLELKFLF